MLLHCNFVKISVSIAVKCISFPRSTYYSSNIGSQFNLCGRLLAENDFKKKEILKHEGLGNNRLPLHP